MATNGNNNNQNEHPPKRQHRLLAYFRDDQVMLLATHNTETISEDMLKTVKAEVESRILEGRTIELLPEVLPQRFSFPAIQEGEGRLAELKRQNTALKKELQKKHQQELIDLELELGNQDVKTLLHPLHQLFLKEDYAPSAQPEPSTSAFSLLVFNLKKPPDDPRDILLNVAQLRAALNGHKLQIDTVDVKGEKKSEILQIEDISPHWAMSAASNGSGTGGPGGLPSPFFGKDTEAKYELNIRQRLSTLYNTVGNGENVEVVILDTAPCAHTLAMAPKNWPHNDLLRGLLGPDGKLSLDAATLEDLKRIDNASLNRHDYEMSDHGLFIAGIIHSIVPKAKIHLVEVLNQWGVGDFLSLAAGLEKARDRIYQLEPGRRLLVNCSWMLDLPLTEDHCRLISLTSLGADLKKGLHLDNPDFAFELAVLHFALKEREQASDIWAICNSISLAGGKVIAAAGNDWGLSKRGKEARMSFQAGKGGKTAEPRVEAPEARYPAGFVSVIGVGALPKESKSPTDRKHRASSYSNKGDKPEVLGIMTLGGEEEDEVVQGGSQKENPRKYKGVLGLYLSETYPVEKASNPQEQKKEFDIRRRNEEDEKNPWASWAGTSFATPIVTGTIAAALSSSIQSETMIQKEIKEILDMLYGKKEIIENGRQPDKGTDVNEDVMVVTQENKPAQTEPT